MKIAILGAGTFGTALAISIDPQHELFLYTIEEDVVHDINTEHRNIQYFPNRRLPKNIVATSSFEAIADAELVFVAIPSGAIADFFASHRFAPSSIIVNGAKGFARGDQLICEALLDYIPAANICALKGPSFANELIFEIPTSFTIGALNPQNFVLVDSAFRQGLIVTDHTTDIRGVEILSIVKNVYAIAIGIVDAYYNSPNVRFLVFTKVINEIRRLLRLYGVNEETLFKYCGIGDLGLTALNDLSRNRTLGLLIGKGFFDNSIPNRVTLEGLGAMDNILNVLDPTEVPNFPILCAMRQLIHNEITVKEFLSKSIF